MKIKKIVMVVILLFFTSHVWAGKVVLLSDLVNPKTITIDGNQIYITDTTSIFLYSLNDFKLQKKFGNTGEGPGEFRINSIWNLSISILPDSIMVDSIGKVTYFSRNGKYLKEMKGPTLGGVLPLGEKFVGYAPHAENGNFYVAISIYKAGQNKTMEKGQVVYKFKHPIQRGNENIDPVNLIRFPMVATYQNKIFADDGKEGEIFIFDSSGKPLNSIKLKYDKIPMPEEYVKCFKTNPQYKDLYERFRQRIKFSSYLPKIRDYRVIDNKIYVLSYKRETGKGEFYIYDLKGTLLKRVMIPFKESDILDFYPYTINDNKIYQLIESEDNEKWELHISDFK